MTVDSEAIFALAAHSHNDPSAFEALVGAMATAWLDERQGGRVFLARGIGRPLWLGKGRSEIFFASTREALEVVEHFAGVRLRKQQLESGSFLMLESGRVALETRFRPDETYVEDNPLPKVRAPQEGASCLERLAVLAAAA
jgi:asparagine synthetase B (glutamine-hydrolysing)